MYRWLLAIKAIVYTLWPITAWATAITLGETMSGVPLLAWLMVSVLSTVSGLAALLSRLRDDTPPRLLVFVVSHMLGSIVSGFVVFLACEGANLDDFVEAVSIALAGYAGAKLMDRWSDKLVDEGPP